MIFHILVSLFGLSLQFSSNIFINIIGIVIIYQHLFVLYMGYKRVPEFMIIIGVFIGIIVGIQNKNRLIYIPLLYSFLSKVPVYVTDINGQIRVIFLTIILSIIFGGYFPLYKINKKRKKKSKYNE